jgi:Flp pilus assembly protein TadG
MNRLRRDERGASLIETALVLPFLLTLGLGVFEFGNLLYKYHLIATGVRDAARYLARFDNPASKETEAKQLAVTGSITGGSPRVVWWSTSQVAVNYTNVPNDPDPVTGERPYRGGNTITIVRVSTSVPYGGIGFLSFLGLGSTINFSLFHEERKIGE